MTMAPQSYFIGQGVAEKQIWGGATGGTFTLTYSVLGGVVAPTVVIQLFGSGFANVFSDVQSNASQFIPEELDTREIVLSTPVTPADSARTLPNNPSAVIALVPGTLVAVPALSAFSAPAAASSDVVKIFTGGFFVGG